MKFVQAITKANFQEQLVSDPSLQDCIAFIEDTSEIYARGKYYSCYVTQELFTQLGEAIVAYINAIGTEITNTNNKLTGKIFGQEKQLTNQNLNDLYNITDAGLYYAHGRNQVTGKPEGVDNFTLSIYRSGSAVVHQVLFAGNTCKMYIRYWEAGSWRTDWIEIGSGGTTNKWVIIE